MALFMEEKSFQRIKLAFILLRKGKANYPFWLFRSSFYIVFLMNKVNKKAMTIQ